MKTPKVLDITIPSYVTIDKLSKLIAQLEKRKKLTTNFKRNADRSFHLIIEVSSKTSQKEIENINSLVQLVM